MDLRALVDCSHRIVSAWFSAYLFQPSWLRQLGVLTVGLLGPARFIFAYLYLGLGLRHLKHLAQWHYSCELLNFGLMGVLIVFAQRRCCSVRLGKQLWI